MLVPDEHVACRCPEHAFAGCQRKQSALGPIAEHSITTPDPPAPHTHGRSQVDVALNSNSNPIWPARNRHVQARPVRPRTRAERVAQASRTAGSGTLQRLRSFCAHQSMRNDREYASVLCGHQPSRLRPFDLVLDVFMTRSQCHSVLSGSCSHAKSAAGSIHSCESLSPPRRDFADSPTWISKIGTEASS